MTFTEYEKAFVREAVKRYLRQLREDLATGYHNDPNFGQEDENFLAGAIVATEGALLKLTD